MKYNFILEIDEISKDEINELVNILANNKIKFNVLKNGDELIKNQKYKEVINKARKYISKHTQHDENGYVVECLYVEEAKELLEILDNKGE